MLCVWYHLLVTGFGEQERRDVLLEVLSGFRAISCMIFQKARLASVHGGGRFIKNQYRGLAYQRNGKAELPFVSAG